MVEIQAAETEDRGQLPGPYKHTPYRYIKAIPALYGNVRHEHTHSRAGALHHFCALPSSVFA